jgi:hypothetical protein
LESRGETSSEMGVTFDNHMRHAWLPDPTSSTCKRFGIFAAVGLGKWKNRSLVFGYTWNTYSKLAAKPQGASTQVVETKNLQSNTGRLQRGLHTAVHYQ